MTAEAHARPSNSHKGLLEKSFLFDKNALIWDAQMAVVWES